MDNNKRDNGSNNEAFDEIMEFLRQLNWPREPLSHQVIRTYYKGNFGANDVIIYTNTQEICITINPVVEKLNGNWGQGVLTLIHNMEKQIQHVELGMDSKGELFVKVSISLDQVTLERFHYLLLGICQVAENILLPVLQANTLDHLKVM